MSSDEILGAQNNIKREDSFVLAISCCALSNSGQVQRSGSRRTGGLRRKNASQIPSSCSGKQRAERHNAIRRSIDGSGLIVRLAACSYRAADETASSESATRPVAGRHTPGQSRDKQSAVQRHGEIFWRAQVELRDVFLDGKRFNSHDTVISWQRRERALRANRPWLLHFFSTVDGSCKSPTIYSTSTPSPSPIIPRRRPAPMLRLPTTLSHDRQIILCIPRPYRSSPRFHPFCILGF